MARTRTRARRSIARREQRAGVATARQVQGKQLSYNNINDTDAAYRMRRRVRSQAHRRGRHHQARQSVRRGGRPRHRSRPTARRWPAIPASAFGGIVALNRTLDAEAARAITEIFTEVIIAPDASDEAIEIVAAKKNLRLLLAGGLPDPRAAGLTVKSVAGGLLVQSRDNATVDEMQLKTVTKRAPTAAELDDLRFAFRVAKHVKSNTIVYAKDRATVGIGAGQMSRVDAARIAARKAEDAAKELKLADAARQRLGGRFGCVLPVRRRPAGRDRGRRHRGDPARRLDARRRGDQGRRRAQRRDGVDRHPAFPALSMKRPAQKATGRLRSLRGSGPRLTLRTRATGAAHWPPASGSSLFMTDSGSTIWLRFSSHTRMLTVSASSFDR